MIVKQNELLIRKIALKFYGVDKEDLYQAGVLGILKACKNYQENNNTKFSTYAYDYIFGEMYNLANNKNIKISKDILRLYKKIEMARYTLAQKLNKIPTDEELSYFLDIPLENIQMAKNCANEVLSLDKKEDDELSIYESTVVKNDEIDTSIYLNDAINTLSIEEQAVIRGRFFMDLTQSELARKLNMSQVKVSRTEKKSIDKIRTLLTT